MVEGKTKSGFTFQIDETKITDNYEVLDVLCKVSKGDMMCITEMVDMILGEKQRDELKEHLRSVDGKVSVKAMSAEVVEILNHCGSAVKKS